MASRPQASAATGFHLLSDKAACCAQWRSEIGDVGLLTSSDQLSCRIGYDGGSGEVLFRLYIPLALQSSPNHRKTPFYVFIDPSHISHLQPLSLDGSEATQACVGFLVSSRQCSSSTDVIALQFLLEQPVTVVGPKETASLEPRPETETQRLLKTLHSLSLATNLTLYLPRNETLVECVDELCARALNGSFRPPPRAHGLASLYSGAGGIGVSALLNEFSAAGQSRQLPAYPGVIRPNTFVSGRASGKRRRTDEEREGPVPNRAWMQRIEKQQSDFGGSLALLRAEMDGVRKERERERSAAPLEFSYTRPVTRSVSAHPEAAATTHRLNEVQRHLQQMHARLAAMEHRMGEMVEQQQQHRVHDTDETGLERSTAGLQNAQASAPHAHAHTPEQQPQTLPNTQTVLPQGILPNQGSQQDGSGTPEPPSDLFDSRSDDERMALLKDGQSQTHWHNVDSDEEREALIHAHDTTTVPNQRVPAEKGSYEERSSSPQPPSDLFDSRSDDSRMALLQASQSQTRRDSVDSDEEREALAHEPSRALARAAAAGEVTAAASRLPSDLAQWLQGASTLPGGRNVHRHPRLRAKVEELGLFMRAGNVAAFDVSRAWCSALLFFHGGGAAAAAGDDGQRRLLCRLVADMADLCRWADEHRRLCDVCVASVRGEFGRLGAVARAAATAASAVERGRALADYESQKALCVVQVLGLSGSNGS